MVRALTLILLVHSWYPQNCCADQDCRPVPCETITKDGNDYEWNGVHFPQSMVQMSKDEHCHVCVSYNGHPHCLFIQLSA